jgi:E1A/CREB-binding protein
LPHCKLSRFIEQRVNRFLQVKNAGAGEVVIRVLNSSDKEVDVKSLMKQKYCPQGFPDKFPYRSKAVFAFEMIEGQEVCFFGLHVQEYGSNAPAPNARYVRDEFAHTHTHIQTRVHRLSGQCALLPTARIPYTRLP